ncbi:hypothetical protein Emed_002610 [Eimeria media]
MEGATEVSKELRSLVTNSSVEPNKLELLFYSASEVESVHAHNYWEARNAAALEDKIEAAG